MCPPVSLCCGHHYGASEKQVSSMAGCRGKDSKLEASKVKSFWWQAGLLVPRLLSCSGTDSMNSRNSCK